MFSSTVANDRIRSVEKILGYEFDDPSRLEEALGLPGSGTRLPDGNRSMALIGDSVIKMILVTKGYEKGDSPGYIGGTLQRFATNRFHAEVGSRFGIDEFICKNPSQLGIPVSDRLLADTVQAMVGAVWLDSGEIKAVEQVMLELGVLSPPEV